RAGEAGIRDAPDEQLVPPAAQVRGRNRGSALHDLLSAADAAERQFLAIQKLSLPGVVLERDVALAADDDDVRPDSLRRGIRWRWHTWSGHRRGSRPVRIRSSAHRNQPPCPTAGLDGP